MRPPCRSAAVSRANAASCEASVSAQGSPLAASSANEGPERAPKRASAPSAPRAIWCGSSPEPSSKPLHSQTSGKGAGSAPRSERNPATGVGARRSAAPSVAGARRGGEETRRALGGGSQVRGDGDRGRKLDAREITLVAPARGDDAGLRL